ncbi:DUF2442 domain-containing protein [Crenobacter caeni]|uniref:DUF2442 domain-containing protein n=1 Tax=Crenobacter caeni TaxID=2705474 RepID=A0A6B2KTV6_9NEIS|nr:DUF2442 domain-containing protein [Crenobacter caeni]NDV13429.1 DUF2442 domain-containing protein [Crenobacter caeni]
MAQTVSVVRENDFVTISKGNAPAIRYPSALLPCLATATPEQFNDYRVCGHRIHWDQIGFSLLFAEGVGA